MRCTRRFQHSPSLSTRHKVGASASSELYSELSTEKLKLNSSQILGKEICRIFVSWYEQNGYFSIINNLANIVVEPERLRLSPRSREPEP